MTDFNHIAFNNDAARRKVLSEMKVVDGIATTYESFLRKYMREMSFVYGFSKNTKHYNRLMNGCQKMARNKWKTFKEAV